MRFKALSCEKVEPNPTRILPFSLFEERSIETKDLQPRISIGMLPSNLFLLRLRTRRADSEIRFEGTLPERLFKERSSV